jgi:hypothetical protein
MDKLSPSPRPQTQAPALPILSPSIKQEPLDEDGLLSWDDPTGNSWDNPIATDVSRTWPGDFYVVDIVKSFEHIKTTKAS